MKIMKPNFEEIETRINAFYFISCCFQKAKSIRPNIKHGRRFFYLFCSFFIILTGCS